MRGAVLLFCVAAESIRIRYFVISWMSLMPDWQGEHAAVTRTGQAWEAARRSLQVSEECHDNSQFSHQIPAFFARRGSSPAKNAGISECNMNMYSHIRAHNRGLRKGWGRGDGEQQSVDKNTAKTCFFLK